MTGYIANTDQQWFDFSKPTPLDGAALAAISQWELAPATKNGAPVASVLVATVTFSMR